MIGGVAYLTLTGEEDQYVAVGLVGQLLDRLGHAVQQIFLLLRVGRVLGLAELILGFGGLGAQRAVADLHGEGAPGDLDDRSVLWELLGVLRQLLAGEVAGEALRVDGG